jgi:hypothetical protein
MIPVIALMIAIYGTGRLLNDGFKRHPQSAGATILTWTVSALAIVALWFLAIAINSQGSSPPAGY